MLLEPDIEQGQLWFHVQIILFPPAVLPVCDSASYFLSPKPFAQMIPCPFWVGSPLNVLNFGILPTTCEATLAQEIWCCGSDTGLGNCVSVPSTDRFSSLPTLYNPSPTTIFSGVATSHPVCTLWPNHISMDHNVWHYFSIFSPSAKTNNVFLLSSLWMTIGCTVVCSYTNYTYMSGFVNAGTITVPSVTLT